MESMEEDLSGGPWYIGNHIIGMDRWSFSFSTDSLKGISSPVWIWFPGLPLSCWDEENIPMIASMIGTPMMLDGNSFKWGKREYARCCVIIDLEKKLPRGVRIEGIHGRTFQRVEYEKLNSLCYRCGKVGHSKDVCPDAVVVQVKETMVQEKVEVLKWTDVVNEDGLKKQGEDYGPWIHVKFRDRRDIPIGVNKFQALEGGLEEGELNKKEKTRMLEKEEPLNQYGSDVHLEVEVPIADQDLKNQITSISNSGKVKLAKELRSLGPMEADTKKRKGIKINSKIMGHYSPIMS
ncbi:uncharacterized protein LOC110109762 [Dendrobium catenatum]|uniref:uncharacterized protein LOC110109762 n=1 Tax=Dendrobium catenatum TaxID=906689 RepID=UPI0009F64049|nr:uncharacterized protein LOC110109762 [Dendrobium catenatum]